jgi:hypothetical protein
MPPPPGLTIIYGVSRVFNSSGIVAVMLSGMDDLSGGGQLNMLLVLVNLVVLYI